MYKKRGSISFDTSKSSFSSHFSSNNNLDGNGGNIKNVLNIRVPSFAGYLTKRSIGGMEAFANWKTRFVLLVDGVIYYYKNQKGMAICRGWFALTRDTQLQTCTKDDKKFCFEITKRNEKPMFMYASNSKEQGEWIRAIKSHIAGLDTTTASPSHKHNSRRYSAPPNSTTSHTSVSSSSSSNGSTNASSSLNGSRHFGLEAESIVEGYDVVKNAKYSDDPKDKAIVQLLEIIGNLRLKIAQQEQFNTELGHDFSKYHGQNQNGRDLTQPFNIEDLLLNQKELLIAAEAGKWHIISLLTKDPAINVNWYREGDEMTALHLACANKHTKAVEELIAKNVDLESKSKNGETPLILATKSNSADLVRLLLSCGANPNVSDNLQNTPIHYAAEHGYLSVAQSLINANANIHIMNRDGNIPLNVCPLGHMIRLLFTTKTNANAAISNGNGSSSNTNANLLQNELAYRPREPIPTAIQDVIKETYQEELNLTPKDFEFLCLLGIGAFGKVYLVRGKGLANKNSYFALKTYDKQKILRKNHAKYINSEKTVLQECGNHPFIVKLYYSFQTFDRLFLAMEFCGGGDLMHALQDKKIFTEQEAKIYLAQIVSALVHLHEKGIIYRDLKPENVVLDSFGNCKLTDFGISKQGLDQSSTANTFCGTPMYLAPEIIKKAPYGFGVDWYCLGIVTYELLTGSLPFYAKGNKALFEMITTQEVKIPDFLQPDTRDLLQRLLRKDPALRLGTNSDLEVKNHPFFATIDWQRLQEKRYTPPYQPNGASDRNISNLPDISNFSTQFTNQVITDSEKGYNEAFENENSIEPGALENFNFTPQVPLDDETKMFSHLLLSQREQMKNQEHPYLPVVSNTNGISEMIEI